MKGERQLSSAVMFYFSYRNYLRCEEAIYQNDRWRRGWGRKSSDIFFPKGPKACSGALFPTISVHPLATSIFDDL
jgi:hypothetical protein